MSDDRTPLAAEPRINRVKMAPDKLTPDRYVERAAFALSSIEKKVEFLAKDNSKATKILHDVQVLEDLFNQCWDFMSKIITGSIPGHKIGPVTNPVFINAIDAANSKMLQPESFLAPDVHQRSDGCQCP